MSSEGYILMKKIICVFVLSFMGVSFVGCGGGRNTSALNESEISAAYSDPNSFKGRTVKNLTLHVFNTDKDGDIVAVQGWQDIKNTNNNTVVVIKNLKVDVNYDDFIRVSGKITGKFKGENAFGGDVSALQIEATKLEKIKSYEAIEAEKVKKVGTSAEKGGVTVTVNKVDFTKDETRVYLDIKNNQSNKVNIYANQAKILQNGQQYEENLNTSYMYYKDGNLSTDIQPGATTSGVVVFQKIDPNTPFSLTIGGWSMASIDELNFRFEIQGK